MEMLVENLAKTKFKSKLDLRSGFWQIGLTPRAQELTAITTPNGRCFRWLCMPFGLQGAPGVFQEMIEILTSKVKNNSTLKNALQKGHIGASLMIVVRAPKPLKIIIEFWRVFLRSAFGTKSVSSSPSVSLRGLKRSTLDSQ